MKNEYKATTCTNCKYFQRYYIIGCGNAFRPTSMGRCINSNVARSLSNKHIQKDEGCDLWQPYELKKLNIQYCTEIRLQRISQDVADVLAILRDIK